MEMIERMASDRLWIYTALAGSLFGAAFLFWFKDTKIAIWAVSKFDNMLEYLSNTLGLDLVTKRSQMSWRTKYPRITSKNR